MPRLAPRAALLLAVLGGVSACGRTPVGFDLLREGPSAAGWSFGGGAPRIARVEVDTETRPAIVVGAARIAWRGRIPRGAAFLHAGVQLLPRQWTPSSRVRARVEAVDGSTREILEVAEQNGGERQHWLDLDVDLARYAGRRVSLEFVAEVDGAAALTAEWAWTQVRLGTSPAPAPARPNVLFILVDTLRADHLPAYGYTRDTAPNLQRLLADHGTVVEHAYSQAPWTLPSVTSFLTSHEPGELLGGDLGTFALPAGVETMGEHFASLGYRTGGFYANPTLHAGIGFARGFETYYCPPPDLTYAMGLHAESVTRRAASFIRAHRDEPFFVYLHLIDPHDPYANPDIVDNRSPFEEAPYTGKVAGSWVHGIWQGRIPLENPAADTAHLVALYDAEIRYADRALGELLEGLPPGVLANTLVVLTADHGEELHDHGGWKHGQTLYEEQIHVPLLVRWDGHVPAGRRLGGTARLLDLLPTLNAAAGGARDPGWQGTDLLPALLGSAPMPRQVALARNLNAGPLRAAVVQDGRKLILFNRRTPFVPADDLQARLWEIDLGRLARAELYDLARDPGERANLAATAPAERSARARTILRQLDRELPGLRVLATGLLPGQRLSGSIEFDSPPARWSSYFLGDADRVRLEGRRLRFELLGDGLDKGVIVEGDFHALRRVERTSENVAVAAFAGDGLAIGDGPVGEASLTARDTPAIGDVPALRLWIAAAQGTRLPPSRENAETLERLRALGYIQ